MGLGDLCILFQLLGPSNSWMLFFITALDLLYTSDGNLEDGYCLHISSI